MNYGCYVHIPFCNGEKCPYCGFYSIPYSPYLADDYIPALLEQARRSKFPPADTLYIGGGTPSILTAKQLNDLFTGLRRILPFTDDLEITIELNPENVTDELVSILTELGITRVSLGVQSLVQRQLMVLGRKHNAQRAIEAFDMLKKGNFSTSIDLMFGVPGQELKEWEMTLDKAIELNPDHISTYCLSFEEGTPFSFALRKGLIAPVDAEHEREMFYLAVEKFSAAGYGHYEISNFAKRGKESKHNMKYWTGAGYFGLGAAAHSFIPGPPRWLRMAVRRSVRSYIKKISEAEQPWDFIELLDLPKRSAEFLMLRLRLIEGFTVEDVARQLPELDAIRYTDFLRPLEEASKITLQAGHLKIPAEHLFISDSIIRAAVLATENYVKQVAIQSRNIVNDFDVIDYVKRFHNPDDPSPQG